MELLIGKYRHYKGNEYEVLGLVLHSETLEEMVLYKQLYGEKRLWVRPAAMFLEKVQKEGVAVQRFEFIGDMNV